MGILDNTRVDKTLDQVREELWSQIASFQEETNYPNQLSFHDSVVRTNVELAAFGLFQLYKYQKFKLTQAFPHLSEGDDLIEHCTGVGITRKEASKTRGVLKVTRDSASGVKTIAVGTIFKTLPNAQGMELRYTTTEEYISPDGDTYAYPKVEAENPGRVYNVGVNLITQFVTTLSDFNGVTNESAWITKAGHDIESEESLKRRYTLQWQSQSELNDKYYLKLALEQDGVIDAHVYDNHPRGQATVDIVLRGEVGADSATLVNNVQAVINENKLQLDDVLVKANEAIPVDITATLYLTSGDTSVIETEVLNRLNSLNDPLSEIAGIRPLQIGENLTLVTLYVAMKLEEVSNITFEVLTKEVNTVIIDNLNADVVITSDQLIQIRNIDLTTTFI